MHLQPKEALEYRIYKRGRLKRKTWQVFMALDGIRLDETSWEDQILSSRVKIF